MLKFFLTLAIVYLLFSLFLFVTQRSLIFQPSNRTFLPEELTTHSLNVWPAENDLRGFLRNTPNADKTVIVFHGNAGQAIDRFYYSNALAAIGARTILAEYPGYGTRAGKPSEKKLVTEAQAIIALASEAFPSDPVYILGESMGTGVASAAVATSKTITDGLILITPFESLASVAQSHYWYTPAKWLVRDKFESYKHMQSYTKPKLLVVAENDTIVPVKHGNKLFDLIPEKKKKITLTKAEHNDWINFVDQQWWESVFSYLADKD